jgi:hypothetical protein
MAQTSYVGPERPANWVWVAATTTLLHLQVSLGWVPPQALAHVASVLGVKPAAVRDHFRDRVNSRLLTRPWQPTRHQLRAISDCADYPHAYRGLLRLGVRTPYSTFDRSLTGASRLLVGGLQAREQARRDPNAPCPICANGAIAHTERKEAA